AAKRQLDDARAQVAQARARLLAAIPTLLSLLESPDQPLKGALETYQTAVDSWTSGPAPIATPVATALDALLAQLDNDIATIVTRQGDNTYEKAKRAVDGLIE